MTDKQQLQALMESKTSNSDALTGKRTAEVINPSDGIKSRKLWISIISLAVGLIFSAVAFWMGKLPADQWTEIVKWLPVGVLLSFGGTETLKLFFANRK